MRDMNILYIWLIVLRKRCFVVLLIWYFLYLCFLIEVKIHSASERCKSQLYSWMRFYKRNHHPDRDREDLFQQRALPHAQLQSKTNSVLSLETSVLIFTIINSFCPFTSITLRQARESYVVCQGVFIEQFNASST